ncbi:MAG: VIT1/CCC1 transporter family protein [Ferruginibacter sp.]|nr:VIT1/CCC1 transporter family protein [Cytophagales bacterium]
MYDSHQHVEKHFTAGATIRDIVIGLSDGLTVPFALAAGLSGAIDSTDLIVTAGMAEIAAGSIAMGLGGYLSAKSEVDHYANERLREQKEVVAVPHREEEETYEIFARYGVTEAESRPVLEALKRKPAAWVDFMMRFELGLEKPDPGRAIRSAFGIGGAYVAGGLIPLIPYMLLADVGRALQFSAGFTLVALLVFGYVKGTFTGKPPVRSGLETMLIGGIAAAAAFGIAKLLG